jgi:hypothetical protein
MVGRVLACAAAAAVLGGCAPTDATVRVPTWRDITTGSHRGEGRRVVVVNPFGSRRREPRCGMKKNGYNVDIANVNCTVRPEAMLPKLLAEELSSAGFVVLEDSRQADPSTLIVSGVVEQAFLEPKVNFFAVTFETDMGLELTVTTGSGLFAERRFYVKGEEATVWASEPDMQRSFDSGVRQLVAAVVGALDNLADRVPPLAPSPVSPAGPPVYPSPLPASPSPPPAAQPGTDS